MTKVTIPYGEILSAGVSYLNKRHRPQAAQEVHVTVRLDPFQLAMILAALTGSQQEIDELVAHLNKNIDDVKTVIAEATPAPPKKKGK